MRFGRADRSGYRGDQAQAGRHVREERAGAVQRLLRAALGAGGRRGASCPSPHRRRGWRRPGGLPGSPGQGEHPDPRRHGLHLGGGLATSTIAARAKLSAWSPAPEPRCGKSGWSASSNGVTQRNPACIFNGECGCFAVTRMTKKSCVSPTGRVRRTQASLRWELMDFNDDTPKKPPSAPRPARLAGSQRASASARKEGAAEDERGRERHDRKNAAKAWQAKKAEPPAIPRIAWPEAWGGGGGTPIQSVIFGQEGGQVRHPRRLRSRSAWGCACRR